MSVDRPEQLEGLRPGGGDLRREPGLVFTIEPMIAARDPRIELADDGWTVRTADGGLSAHEEHTVMVASGGPVVLTAPAKSAL